MDSILDEQPYYPSTPAGTMCIPSDIPQLFEECHQLDVQNHEEIEHTLPVGYFLIFSHPTADMLVDFKINAHHVINSWENTGDKRKDDYVVLLFVLYHLLLYTFVKHSKSLLDIVHAEYGKLIQCNKKSTTTTTEQLVDQSANEQEEHQQHHNPSQQPLPLQSQQVGLVLCFIPDFDDILCDVLGLIDREIFADVAALRGDDKTRALLSMGVYHTHYDQFPLLQDFLHTLTQQYDPISENTMNRDEIKNKMNIHHIHQHLLHHYHPMVHRVMNFGDRLFADFVPDVIAMSKEWSSSLCVRAFLYGPCCTWYIFYFFYSDFVIFNIIFIMIKHTD